MKIALLGDVAFFGKFSVENGRIYDYFSELAAELKNYDFVVGNLETPLTHNPKPFAVKSAHIKATPDNIALLKFLHISHVNLANNHIFDYGIEGYLSTLAVLEKNNIGIFGADRRQCFIDDSDSKVALSGYCCYSANGNEYLTARKQHGINILDGFEVEKNLLDNQRKGFFNICSIHCGQEHVNKPNYDHVRMARKLAAKVPYVFYGHHPHVLQGVEAYKDSILAYSQGNLCFDDVYTSKSRQPLIKQNENNKTSIILELTIKGNKIEKYAAIPLFDNGERILVGNNPDIISKLNAYSDLLNTPMDEYIAQRNAEISSYILNRKKKRDLNWYLKRLKFDSVRMILNARKNQECYNRAVKTYIESE